MPVPPYRGGPTDVGPGLVDPVDKRWTTPEVKERTRDEARARVSWRTNVSGVQTMTVTDGPLDVNGSAQVLEDSVFDAFNLIRIPEITTEDDPYIAYDQVVGVQYWDGAGWVDIVGRGGSGPVCSPTDPCRGSLPQIALTDAEIDPAQGVRIVFEERDDRGPVTTVPGTLRPRRSR